MAHSPSPNGVPWRLVRTDKRRPGSVAPTTGADVLSYLTASSGRRPAGQGVILTPGDGQSTCFGRPFCCKSRTRHDAVFRSDSGTPLWPLPTFASTAIFARCCPVNTVSLRGTVDRLTWGMEAACMPSTRKRAVFRPSPPYPRGKSCTEWRRSSAGRTRSQWGQPYAAECLRPCRCRRARARRPPRAAA